MGRAPGRVAGGGSRARLPALLVRLRQGVKTFDPIVAEVGDVDVAGTIDGKAHRLVEAPNVECTFARGVDVHIPDQADEVPSAAFWMRAARFAHIPRHGQENGRAGLQGGERRGVSA